MNFSQILFISVFFLIANRQWMKSFFEGFTKGRPNSKDLEDPKILNFIKDKTDLKLKKIKLLDTDTTWAMMAGLPFMPLMVLSKDAYDNFSKDELQWVLLHEAGHYILWHNVKMIVLQLVFIVIGVFILSNYDHLLLSFTLGILFFIINTQLSRNFEYEANNFALFKMDNPKGLANMYDKAKERWRKKGKKGDTLFQKMFNVWILEIYKNLVQKATS